MARKRGHQSRVGGGRRRRVHGLVEASRRRMFWAFRNLPFAPVELVTLTYGSRWPSSGVVVHQQLGRLFAAMRRRGIGAAWKVEYQARGAPHIALWVSCQRPKAEWVALWLDALGGYAQRGYHEDQRVQVTTWWGGEQHAAFYAAGYTKKAGPKAYQDQVPVFLEERVDSRGQVHYAGPARDTGRMWGVVGARVAEELHQAVPDFTLRAIRSAYVAVRRTWKSGRRWRDRGTVGFRAYGVAGVARILLRGHQAVGRGCPGGPRSAGTRAPLTGGAPVRVAAARGP